MSIVKFEVIKLKNRIRIPCPICHQKFYRIISAEQTVNPYNRKADGLPKTKAEVYMSVSDDLIYKIKKFSAEGIMCNRCQEEMRKNG